MAVVGSRIAVDDTAGGAVLHTGSAGVSGTKMVIQNIDATDTVALGPPGVTFANGFLLGTTSTISIELAEGDILHGICDTAKSVVVHILKAGE